MELLHCDAVGSFMAAIQHVDVGALGPPLRLVSQLVMSSTPGFASQFVAAGGLQPQFTNKCAHDDAAPTSMTLRLPDCRVLSRTMHLFGFPASAQPGV